MSGRFRAHFDGRVLIPDDPVVLPLHQVLDLEVVGAAYADVRPPSDIAERLTHLRAFAGSLQGRPIPLESLRRENLYGERM